MPVALRKHEGGMTLSEIAVLAEGKSQRGIQLTVIICQHSQQVSEDLLVLKEGSGHAHSTHYKDQQLGPHWVEGTYQNPRMGG